MKKELRDCEDYLNQILIAISQHSLGSPTLEPMELKCSRKEYIFNILDFVYSRISVKTFESIVFTNTDIPLYCYSTHSIEQLTKISNKKEVYLNTSKVTDIGVSAIPNKDYKYYYKFRLKPNHYGLDVNKFISLFSKRKQKRIHDDLYGKAPEDNWILAHQLEEEIIVDFNSLEFIEELKYEK